MVWPEGTIRSSPSTSQTMPSRSKPIRIERRCSTPARTMRSGERVTAASPISEPTSMWSGPIE